MPALDIHNSFQRIEDAVWIAVRIEFVENNSTSYNPSGSSSQKKENFILVKKQSIRPAVSLEDAPFMKFVSCEMERSSSQDEVKFRVPV